MAEIGWMEAISMYHGLKNELLYGDWFIHSTAVGISPLGGAIQRALMLIWLSLFSLLFNSYQLCLKKRGVDSGVAKAISHFSFTLAYLCHWKGYSLIAFTHPASVLFSMSICPFWWFNTMGWFLSIMDDLKIHATSCCRSSSLLKLWSCVCSSLGIYGSQLKPWKACHLLFVG